MMNTAAEIQKNTSVLNTETGTSDFPKLVDSIFFTFLHYVLIESCFPETHGMTLVLQTFP